MTSASEGDRAVMGGPHVAVIIISHNGQRWLPTVVDALPSALTIDVNTINAAGDELAPQLPITGSPEPAEAVQASESEPDDQAFALWNAANLPLERPVVAASVVRVAVDTGSSDESRELLARAGFTVLEAPGATPFGRAVAMAVSHLSEVHPEVEWLWLLHDDSAPVANSLPAMLGVAVGDGADIVGPKIHNWSGAPIILERGVRVSGAGRLYYGVDQGERDQGQYDHVGGEPVYAVSSAGMLLSMRAWIALNGFDPALATAGDDIDFCRRARRAGFTVSLCTTAAVRHVRAMSRRRRKEPLTNRMGADARYAVMHILIAHAPGRWVWWVILRLTVGSLLRAALQLLQRDVRGARDQIDAVARLYAHPSRVRLSRARAAAAGPLPVRERDLLLPLRQRWRMGWHALGSVIERVTAIPQLGQRPMAQAPIFLPEQESAEPPVAASRRRQIWQRILHRPLTLLVTVASLVAAVRGVNLLISDAPLGAPRLADTRASSWSLLSSYAAGWHDIGRGLQTAAPGWMLVLSLAALPFLGHVSGLVAFVIVFFVPLMTLVSALALRVFIKSSWVSAGVALLVAASPVFTTAAKDGDVSTLTVGLLTPVILRLAARGARTGDWSTALGTALIAAAVLAFSPMAWVQIIIILACCLIARRAPRSLWIKFLVVISTSVALLLPWPLTFIQRPWAALVDAGPADTAAGAHVWSIAGLSAHEMSPWLLGFSVAALLALVRPKSRATVVRVWMAALIPLAVFVAGVKSSLIVSGIPDAVHPSVQSSVALWSLAAGICIALAADGLLDEIRHADVGASHISAAIATVTVAVFAVVTVGAWLPTADSRVVRGRELTVPEFVAIDLMRPLRPRALVLQADDPNPVEFYIASRPTRTLGDADMLRVSNPDDELANAVATLVSVGEPFAGARIRAAQFLADAAIKYVVLPDSGKGAEDIAIAVASTPGLKPMTTAGEQQTNWVWRVTQFAGRASFARTDETDRAAVREFVIGTGPGAMDLRGTAKKAALPAGDIRIADASTGWRATVDGRGVDVARSASGVVQIAVKATAQTRVHVWRDDSLRRWWIAGQTLLWLLVLIMAFPSRQRVSVADEDGDS